MSKILVALLLAALVIGFMAIAMPTPAQAGVVPFPIEGGDCDDFCAPTLTLPSGDVCTLAGCTIGLGGGQLFCIYLCPFL